ncbi:unnamed protein product [Protopolystoma xenopodis]|uniref:Uncharacterized protein n=1 Tax=Protopolystoma xenopodis TaxID=117903 RepID=A0A448X676_9PLAT|nr:unnamed protein product [Protopolystoma xenopodis]
MPTDPLAAQRLRLLTNVQAAFTSIDDGLFSALGHRTQPVADNTASATCSKAETVGTTTTASVSIAITNTNQVTVEANSLNSDASSNAGTSACVGASAGGGSGSGTTAIGSIFTSASTNLCPSGAPPMPPDEWFVPPETSIIGLLLDKVSLFSFSRCDKLFFHIS